MRFSVLGSGSKGNCTLVEAGTTRLLIDAGFSCKETLARLAVLGIERADVLGWSMGAMTALEMALAHPDRVDRIVAYGAAAEPGPVVAAVEVTATLKSRS